MDDIEPLDRETWFWAIKKSAQRQGRAHGEEIDRLLRHTYHLGLLAPLPLRNIVRTNVLEERFEGLLECEAYESAAIALIGPAGSYSLTASANGNTEATVRLTSDIEKTARSTQLARVLLEAWTQCLVALENSSQDAHSPGPRLQ